MAWLVKVLYLSIFIVFIVWGFIPHSEGVDPFTHFVYEHTQGISEIEMQIIIHLVVPGFILSLGWTSWDLLTLFDEKLSEKFYIKSLLTTELSSDNDK
ncbi:hypothetical protein [Shewanella sp. NIFS-20-20]|uniref:hypothetical protein n=1 Tax=Shewanella sp. NIFS-20-20 TaxID=2853806 RepID=UPI001C48FDCA|nr:hypothetical protein [Shewanella sp. NIFS-20-20]MBV7317466.1 hypothetical protein [Shewanella sp. NIFS-20-20]